MTIEESQRVRSGRRLGVGRGLAVGVWIGGYVIKRIIASGGFGTVYEVGHRRHAGRAALKLLHADMATNSDLVARFLREARLVSRVRHPHVVQLHDVGMLRDGRPYFVMELLEGLDLETYLGSHGRISPEEAIAILNPLCSALATAHGLGIIHRDVKASNVFLAGPAERPRVVLLDFGVAKLLGDGVNEATTSRHIIGTPCCMAPEQLAGGAVDARTDVYLLGALAYHMLCGQLPFGQESLATMEYMHLHAPRPRPSSQVTLSPALDEVVVRAMARRPEERYAGPAELALAFGAATTVRRDVTIDAAAVRSPLAFGVHAEVDTSDEASVNEGLLSAYERVLGEATRALAARAFFEVLRTDNSALMIRPLEHGHTRSATVETVRQLAVSLGGMADPRLRVTLSLHLDRVDLVGDKVCGGPLTRSQAWLPAPAISQGVRLLASAAALEGAGVDGEIVDGFVQLA